MEQTFQSVWRDVRQKYAQKPALSDRKRTYTYSELNQQALKVANELATKNIRKRCVLICLDDPLDSIVAIVGVLLSGNAYYYLTTEAYKESASILPYLNPGAVISNSINNAPGYPVIPWENLEPAPSEFDGGEISAGGDPFAAFRTSGSTGEPKLVMHSQRFIMRESLSMIEQMEISASDRRDYAGSLMFSASLGAIFPTLLAGAELVIHSTLTENVYDLPRFWKEKQITMTTVPVNALRILAKKGDSLIRRSQLRLVVISAEPASAEDVQQFFKFLPENTVLLNGYAATETRGISSATFKFNEINWNLLGTVGRPVPGKRVYIVDEEGREARPGETGEIVVEARDLPKRYLNLPEDQDENFYKRPDGNTCFKTGDIGYFTPEGFLVLKGRKDGIVKVNGIKVNLTETELCLSRCAGVMDVIVLQKKNQLLHTFISVNDRFNLENAKFYAQSNLPPLNVPSSWHVLEALPKTRTGKLDRKLLKDLLLQTDTSQKEKLRTDEPLDLLIAKIWKKELELDSIPSPEADFFKDLGGNSLLCAVCTNEVECQLGLKLPLNAGYTYTTPKSLSGFISEYRVKPVIKIEIENSKDHRPDLYLIPPYPGDRRTYHLLEESLTQNYNVFFLSYNPIGEEDQIHHFTKLISHLADQIIPGREVQLLGFSFGGILSYFLTQELERRQQPVQKLILLDSPTYKQYTPYEKLLNLGIRAAHKIWLLPRAPLTIARRYLFNFKETYQEYRSQFTQEKAKISPQHPSRVIWTYATQFPQYRKINADILLFKVTERGRGYQFKPDFKWDKWTHKSLKTVSLFGWHEELFSVPSNVELIKRELTPDLSS